MGDIIINQRKVAILLSSYNGEKYISELIDSVMGQSYEDFTLYIRDDMSKDSTPQILSKYKRIYPTKLIQIPSTENLGSKSSFLTMLKLVESDYYMFCDQDDIWRTDKIEVTLRAIRKAELDNPLIPIIVHTDLKIVDGNLKPIAESYWEYSKLLVNITHKYNYFCHFNDVTGCTMMFNNLLKKKAINNLTIQLPYFIHHDHYLALLCVANSGIILPVFQNPILFRRHGDNVTNPFEKGQSILKKPLKMASYIRDFYSRWLFFKRIKKISLISFIIGKISVLYIIKNGK